MTQSADYRTSTVEQYLSTVIFRPAWVGFGLISIAFILGAEIPLEYQWIPLAASIILLGLPHGAVDHLALPRIYNSTLNLRWMFIVVGLYALFGGLYLLLWFITPVVAFAVFIGITWLHWGQGELYPLLRIAHVEHLSGPVMRGLTTLVRGALPMLVPLIAFPDQYQLVAEELVGLYSVSAAATIESVFTTELQAGVGIFVGILIMITLAAGGFTAIQQGSLKGWALDAGETGLLIVFFLSVPPILAIGIYFCFWHALRHITRLVAVDQRASAALETGNWKKTVWRFTRDAAPLTFVSILLLGILYMISPGTPSTIAEYIALYLVLIAVLTLPHVVVVSWMDYRQQIFTRI